MAIAGSFSDLEVFGYICKIADVTIQEMVIKSAATSVKGIKLFFSIDCVHINSASYRLWHVTRLCTASKTDNVKVVLQRIR